MSEAGDGPPDPGALAEAVLAASREGVLAVDPAGRIRSANPAAEEMFGASPGALAGRDVSELVPADLRDRHRLLVAGFDPATSGAHVMGRGRQLSARRLDGGTFPVEVTLTQVRLPGTRLVCANVRDVTERRRLDAEGVESHEQRQAATRHGCHRGQGFLFAQPLDLNRFTNLAVSGKPLP